MKKSTDPISKRFAAKIFPQIINELHKKGFITDSDLDNPEQVKRKLREIFARPDFQLSTVSDHREVLEEVARDQYRKENIQLAISLLVVFVEHTINHIIRTECLRSGMTSKSIRDVLKGVNVNAKFTWLLILLKLPSINRKHLDTISKAVEIRNSFFHYKWNPEHVIGKEEDHDNGEEIQRQIYSDLIKAARYLKTYHTRVLYKGKMRKMRRAVQ